METKANIKIQLRAGDTIEIPENVTAKIENGIVIIEEKEPELSNFIDGYLINAPDNIFLNKNKDKKFSNILWKTEKQATTASNLCELTQHHALWNKGLGLNKCYITKNSNNVLRVRDLDNADFETPLKFKDKETAKAFLNKFKEQLELCKMFL